MMDGGGEETKASWPPGVGGELKIVVRSKRSALGCLPMTDGCMPATDGLVSLEDRPVASAPQRKVSSVYINQ